MLNFYRRYLQGAASILKPLTDATHGAGSKHSHLEWTKEMEKAFVTLRWLSQTRPTWPPHPGGRALPGSKWKQPPCRSGPAAEVPQR